MIEDFIAAVDRVLASFPSRRRLSPAQLLNQWESFVQTAVRGYPAGWYEFDNDRRVRDVIQAILNDQDVLKTPEAKEWATAISRIDGVYKKLLIPIPNDPHAAWWMNGVPRYGGDELVADVARLHGLQIAPRAANVDQS